MSSAMDISEPDAPPPTSVLFARGVIARLASWSALRIAIEQGWGGPEGVEKRRWLASVIVDAFEEQDPTPDTIYIEEMLLQVMEDEFETTVEDSSAESVANDIVRLWDEVHRGKQDMMLRLEEQADNLKGKNTGVREIATDEEWEDDDDDEEDGPDGEEAPTLMDNGVQRKEEAEVDEDGFTIVRGKGKARG